MQWVWSLIIVQLHATCTQYTVLYTIYGDTQPDSHVPKAENEALCISVFA